MNPEHEAWSTKKPFLALPGWGSQPCSNWLELERLFVFLLPSAILSLPFPERFQQLPGNKSGFISTHLEEIGHLPKTCKALLPLTARKGLSNHITVPADLHFPKNTEHVLQLGIQRCPIPRSHSQNCSCLCRGIASLRAYPNFLTPL